MTYFDVYGKGLNQCDSILNYAAHLGEVDRGFIQRLIMYSRVFWFFLYADHLHQMISVNTDTHYLHVRAVGDTHQWRTVPSENIFKILILLSVFILMDRLTVI
ncbi:hypothetical protein SAMN05216516_109109 [Izhakiella capsodis]|uniref:Uncharacterized protein n=1 Tax=Izhakiella capsodis TaxID=1367852 RepID=A0A1I4ZRY8_9GAMM|nr:hypothetical protein SAMN05216516_109109 [Izhakiella capsodis]